MDTAVVTGASRGIGRAVARHFAGEGVHVTLCSREADAVEAVAETIEDAGGAATAMRADVRDEYDVERLLETAARAGDAPGVDCVVANAAVSHGDHGETPLSVNSYTAFDDALRTNARGVFATVREALPHLTDDARVLVPSGSHGNETDPGLGSYAVSKATAEAIARQFAAERDHVVWIVDPGTVATELTDGAGERTPEEVAPLFWWAAAVTEADAVDGRVVDVETWKRASD